MKSGFKILLVEDSIAFRLAVKQLLEVYNDVDEAESLKAARASLQKYRYDVVIIDKGLEDGDGMDLISEIKAFSKNTVIIMLTSDSDFGSIKHCIAKGADDYVVKTETSVPDLLVRIPVTVSKAAAARKLESLEEQLKSAFRYEIVGGSTSTIQLRETILSLKGMETHVLITGESGTGKELIARRLNAIEKEDRPFVAINCGAISEHLIESELFGHKRGSFTDATQDRVGKFELAHGGDIFLDEIGEMPLSAQVKLLRVIQEGEVTRVGDSRVIPIKCRVIAATNRDLKELVRIGRFREDLYHRLNVFKIETTPLRNRKTDISDLAKIFTVQLGGANFSITHMAIRALCQYSWPGNTRELKNTIERAIIYSRQRGSREITYDDVILYREEESNEERIKRLEVSFPEDISELNPKQFKKFLLSIEKEYLKAALELTNGNVTELAEKLGMARSTMFKHVKDCGVQPPAPKTNTGFLFSHHGFSNPQSMGDFL